MPSSVLTFNELLDIKDSTPPGGVDKRDELEPSKPESTTLASGCCFCGACANSRKSDSLGEGASDFERQPMATTVSFHGIAMHKSEESYPDVPRTTSALSLSTPALANESALEIARTSSSAFSPADNQSLAASDSMLILAVSRDATAGSFTFVNRERSPSPRTSAPSASNLSLATSNETAFPPRGQLLQPPFPAAQNLSFAPYFRRVEEREMISCQICLEEEPLDESVVIQSCGHAFGRECMRSYILSRLDEMRFPIPCPCCSAADEPGANPSLVTSGIATQVNLSDADCARWDELEFLLHAVRFECGKCQKAHAMDRHKLVKEKSKKWIDCPTPGCDQTWCRHCQATIDPTSKKKHVCEGKKELKSLLKKEGWRHCPGCNIPVQKSSGCNHIAVSRRAAIHTSAIVVEIFLFGAFLDLRSIGQSLTTSVDDFISGGALSFVTLTSFCAFLLADGVAEGLLGSVYAIIFLYDIIRAILPSDFPFAAILMSSCRYALKQARVSSTAPFVRFS